MIFEATGRFNAIGRIAMAQVEAALDAGWRVSVVAHRLDEALQDRVEWLKLYNPPRGFAIKWLTARYFIKKAMGDPTRFDVIHGHQPQVADLCDIFHCHFISRMAHEVGCLGGVTRTLRDRIVSRQHQLILGAEDRCFRRFNPQTQLVLVSPLLKEGFERLYGLPPRYEVLLNAAPEAQPVTLEDRRAARQRLGMDPSGCDVVVGYLGGMQRRKGYDAVLEGLGGAEGVTLLMGGQGTEALSGGGDAALKNVQGLGLVEDTAGYYAALDVMVVPSRFDPCPVVVMESAAHGVPVVCTPGVGNGGVCAEAGAGAVWDGITPLRQVVMEIASDLTRCRERALAFADAARKDRFIDRFIRIYEEILEHKDAPAVAKLADSTL